MTTSWKNFYYPQKLKKLIYNKNIKPKSYTPADKVWLNKKYIKISPNQKWECKFFKLFQVFYLVKTRLTKSDFIKKKRIMFFMYHCLSKTPLKKSG